MRYCETTTELPSGAKVEEGEWVAALIGAANLDPRAFQNPYLFSFDPAIRKIENYLLFNEQGSHRECWGRDRVAMAVLEECVMAAGRLRGLRRVAGAGGEPSKLVGRRGDRFAGTLHAGRFKAGRATPAIVQATTPECSQISRCSSRS